GGANWNNNENWLTGPIDTWYGVTVSKWRVSQLEMSDNNLSGNIPNEIGKLSNLTVLNLRWNYGLQGTSIPDSIVNLENLTELNLVNNRHSGSIPESIGNLSALEYLNLEANWNLTGSIPASIGSMTNLRYLNLGYNNLTGSIPAEIGNLANLQELYLYNNQLSGSIPASIGNLTNLSNLNSRGNNLTGNIPAEIGNLTDLNYLYLNNNQLTGSIPVEIGNLTNLEALYLENNQLSGSIPLEIGNASNLRYIRLQNNQLTGTIPEEMGNLNNLWSLYLDNNQLEGEIPASFENVNFGFLYLHNNKLSGDLPSSLAQMINNPVSIPEEEKVANESQPLYLRDGSLASSVQKDAALNVSYRLKVENNKFTFANLETSGIAPGSIETFTYAPQDTVPGLEYIAGINSLTVVDSKEENNNYQWYYDALPLEAEMNDTLNNIEASGGYFCKVTNSLYPDLELNSEVYGNINYTLSSDSLALVALYNATDGDNWNNNSNWLTGPVDTWFGVTISEERVTELQLRWNNLNGFLINEIGDLNALAVLDLQNNRNLTGSIPSTIGNINNLENLNLFYSNFTGSIPLELWNLTSLGYLDLSYNNFTGTIPSEIAGMVNLYYLVLQGNQFTGSIPEELLTLTGLTGLYLGRNNFTSSVMPDFSVLVNLRGLGVDNCNFTGSIPTSLLEMSSLEQLRISNNPFNPEPMPDFSGLSNLQFLQAYYCNFTGNVPESLLQMSSIRNLNIDDNLFDQAPVPDFSSLYNLQELSAANCNFTGILPMTLFSLVRLNYLNLSDNQINGNIPAEIGNLTDLNYLYLYDNQLTGSIPLEIGNASNLRYIRLQNNQLTGVIPAELGNLDLWSLYLDNNQLEGEIPASFENVNFGYLYLHNNNLRGDLPSSLAQMVNNPLNVHVPEEEKVANESQPLYLRDGSLASSVQKDAALNVQYRLKVENNKFTFANLESLGVLPGSIGDFSYAPQDTTLAITTDGETITASDGNSVQNLFTWYSNGSQLSDTIRTINVQGEGQYSFSVTNPVYPELTLYSDTITIEAPDVPVNLDVPTATINAGDDECYNAQNDITVADDGSVEVSDGASATFIAGHSIRFLPGFHAQAGSYVDAHITTTGSFCDDLPAAPMMAAQSVVDISTELEKPEPEEKSFERQSLVVYPNPNNGSFTIKLENIESETRVLMYSSIGQKVYDITMSESLHSVELPNVQRGIYFIKAINNQKQFDQKIVIQ
nr:leucine-rich repeat domain-containing protein [Prolixibacteraceae bacterium]